MPVGVPKDAKTTEINVRPVGAVKVIVSSSIPEPQTGGPSQKRTFGTQEEGRR